MADTKKVAVSTGSGDTKEIKVETLLKLDDSFNIASLLGKSLLTAAYQAKHPGAPDGGVSDPVNVSIVADSVSVEDGRPVFPSDSYETSVKNQMDQLEALFTPEVKAFIKPSALFDMLLLAVSKFGLDSDQLEARFQSHEYCLKSAVAWVIAKRVFAIRHPEEAINIISISTVTIQKAKPIPFSPLDETDKTFVIEACGSVQLDDLDEDLFPQVLERISQLPPQNERYIPLLSKPFREQRAIAARNRTTPVNVGNATIKARIGKDGDPPVELSEFEMLIQQVIGEMIQYSVRLNGDGGLPIRITPEQIFRWMYYDGSNMAKPSPEVRQKIVSAVDKLIQTPAELHILEQLEKHTKLKSKPGYKKLMKNEGKIIGTLITGKHYSASYNGKMLEDTFVIYDMPMFYYYSSFTGQLLKVDSKLITGETVKTGQTRKTYNDVILREHILYRVNLIKREMRDKNKKIIQNNKYNGGKQKPFSTFTKVILLDSLAEESEIILDTPKKLEVFRNKVLDYLKELQSQGEIKKSEPKYESRRIVGVSITV